MQFAFVQFLEGYWGTSRLACRLRFLRIKSKGLRLGGQLDRLAQLDRQIEDLWDRRESATGDEYDRLTTSMIELMSLQTELIRITATAPTSPEAVMPSRLGNVLRRYEWSVGKAYCLETITTVPFLSRVAAPGDMDYVNDQRGQLDLAVRMTIVGFVATGLTLVFLARHGLWLLVAVVPYLAGYLSYQGAVTAAAAYGRALGVLVTLNRFALYERLRLPPVADLAAERTRNTAVKPLLRHEAGEESTMVYRAEPPPPPATAEPSPSDTR